MFEETKSHHPKEYRIPDLDCKNGPKPTLPNGTIVKFTRRVDRVGYEIDKFSFTKEEWEAKALEIVSYSTGLDKAIVQRVVKELSLYSPYKGIKSRVYSALMQTRQTKSENVNIRAMWFVDSAYDGWGRDYWIGEIVGRVRRWTGKYYPASGGYSSYDGYDNYEPAQLWGHNQNLYQVQMEHGPTWLVYPADAKVVD